MFLRQLRNNLRIQIHPVTNPREIINHNRDLRLARHIVVETLDNLRRRRLAEIRTRQQQCVIRSRIGRIPNEFQNLLRGVPTHARHDGVVWAYGFAGCEQELLALFARQEEGLGVCAEDYEAGEVCAEVGEVGGLGG